MYGEDLAYVALVVDDVEDAAGKLERDFRLTRSDHTAEGVEGRVPLLSVGRTALALFARGSPYVAGEMRTGVHHIALAVDDAERAAREIAQLASPISTAPAEQGLDGSRRCLVSLEATNGIRTFLIDRIDRVEAKPDFVQRLDHLGIIGTDNKLSLQTWCTGLGCEFTGEQFDTEIQSAVEHFVFKTAAQKTYTVMQTRPAEFVAAVHDLFIRIGDCDLEIIMMLDSATAHRASGDRAGNTKQDHGALARFLNSRRGASPYRVQDYRHRWPLGRPSARGIPADRPTGKAGSTLLPDRLHSSQGDERRPHAPR